MGLNQKFLSIYDVYDENLLKFYRILMNSLYNHMEGNLTPTDCLRDKKCHIMEKGNVVVLVAGRVSLFLNREAFNKNERSPLIIQINLLPTDS